MSGDVKVGDYVQLIRPPEGEVAEVWQLRRDYPSLVTHIINGDVICTEPEEKHDRRAHEFWSASLTDVAVVKRATYLDVSDPADRLREIAKLWHQEVSQGYAFLHAPSRTGERMRELLEGLRPSRHHPGGMT